MTMTCFSQNRIVEIVSICIAEFYIAVLDSELSHNFKSVCGVVKWRFIADMVRCINDVMVQLQTKRLGCCSSDLYRG